MTTQEYLDTLTPTAEAYSYDNIIDNNSPNCSFADFMNILKQEMKENQ